MYHCREIFMNHRGVPAAFIHSLNVAVKSVRRTLMDFMQNSNVPVRNILWCEFHALAYEIECSERAKDADPDLGKGHSNLPESTFSVLTKFRSKDTNLHNRHYHAATNLGLIQANMTWCYKNRGPEYHWIPDLYSWMGLPILDGIQEMVCLVLSTSYVIFYMCYMTTIN